jgi:UDP-3-O-[3-hydroxymyristoyl] glucosamine N-acyltransferase
MIAGFLGGQVAGDKEAKVHTVSSIEEGEPGALTYLTNPKYEKHLYKTRASIVLVNKDFTPSEPVTATLIKVEDTGAAVLKLLQMYQAAKPRKQGISERASISERATLGEDCYVGDFAVIEAGARIGADCQIYPQVYIGDGVTVGDGTILYPGVKIYEGCVIGSRCILHAGAVIGADGFGFIPNAAGGFDKIPQLGNVVVEDDVEIGANTTIDRGALADTVIERGVRLDNLIHIAHNCRVGAHTAMAACVGVAGSTSIGANCMIGGAAMISGHLKIGDRVHISGGTLVAKNLDKPGQYTAVYPLATHKEWLGNAAHVRQLGKLAARVKQLEARLAAANATDPHSTKEPQ